MNDQTLNNVSDKILKRNIVTGDVLCKQMGMSLSQSLNETQTNDPKRPLMGSSACELYLACQHTKICSLMLNRAVKNLGVVACPFKSDEFIQSLRMSSKDQTGTYSVLGSIRRLACTSSYVSKRALHFRTIVGNLDQDSLIKSNESLPPKPEKTRLTRKKEAEGENATQKEVINITSTQNRSEVHNDGTSNSEILAQAVFTCIKDKFNAQQTSQNMLEIACANTVPGVLGRLFGIAFVVRDGYVSLSRDSESELPTNGTLMVRPDKPPVKRGQNHDDNSRKQYIVSYSAKFLKTLVESGQVHEG